MDACHSLATRHLHSHGQALSLWLLVAALFRAAKGTSVPVDGSGGGGNRGDDGGSNDGQSDGDSDYSDEGDANSPEIKHIVDLVAQLQAKAPKRMVGGGTCKIATRCDALDGRGEGQAATAKGTGGGAATPAAAAAAAKAAVMQAFARLCVCVCNCVCVVYFCVVYL